MAHFEFKPNAAIDRPTQIDQYKPRKTQRGSAATKGKKMSGKKMMRRAATLRLHLLANHFLANSIGDAGLTVWKSSPPAKIFKLFSRREEERQNHVLQNDEGGCGDPVRGRFTLGGAWACMILYS